MDSNQCIFAFLLIDIEVPKEFEFRNDVDEEEDEKSAKEDTWSDLGIENFVEQMLQIHQPVIAPQSQASNLGVRAST